MKAYLQQLEQATVLFQHDTRLVYFMNNRCGLNEASLHTCTRTKFRRDAGCVVACLWYLNQGGHTNVQSLQQIYTQYLA